MRFWRHLWISFTLFGYSITVAHNQGGNGELFRWTVPKGSSTNFLLFSTFFPTSLPLENNYKISINFLHQLKLYYQLNLWQGRILALHTTLTSQQIVTKLECFDCKVKLWDKSNGHWTRQWAKRTESKISWYYATTPVSQTWSLTMTEETRHQRLRWKGYYRVFWTRFKNHSSPKTKENGDTFIKTRHVLSCTVFVYCTVASLFFASISVSMRTCILSESDSTHKMIYLIRGVE